MTMEEVGRAMSWSLVARIAAFAAAFGANILIVRAISEHEWGILSEVKTILQFVMVIVMIGIDAAILKFVPMLRVKGGGSSFKKTIRSLVFLQIGVWLCILIASRFGGGFFNAFFRDHSGRFGLYLQVAIICFIFELFMLLVSNLFVSWYETKRLAVVVICGNAVYFAGVVLVLKMGFGIVGILVASGAMNVLMLAALAPRAKALLRSVPSPGQGPDIRSVLRFSLPFVVTGLLNQIVWRQSEVLFLGHFKGAEAAGFFRLAYGMPQMLLEFIPLTLWPIIMAGTSEAYARDEENLARAIRLYFKVIFLLVIPVAAMGFAFARPLVPILYGAKMLPAALLTQLFFVVFCYSFLYTPLSMAFYIMGKSWINMLIFISLAVIEIGLDLALIPRYGLWGAFVPVSFVLMLAVVSFHMVMRKVRPEIGAPFGFIFRCVIAAVPTCLLSMLTARWSSPAAIALMAPAGFALLIAGFRVMRIIGAEEKEMIRRLPIPGRDRILSLF